MLTAVGKTVMTGWDAFSGRFSSFLGKLPESPATVMLLDNLSPAFMPISLACCYAPQWFSGSLIERFSMHLVEHHHGFLEANLVTRPDYLRGVEVALAAVPAAKRVLDVCTGTGPAAFRAKELFPAAHVTGVDNSEFALKMARDKAEASGSDVHFENANVHALPYADDRFDVVMVANMFPFWKELIRVLRPGGRLIYGWGVGGIWHAAVWPLLLPGIRRLGGIAIAAERTYPGFYGMVGKGA